MALMTKPHICVECLIVGQQIWVVAGGLLKETHLGPLCYNDAYTQSMLSYNQ